MTSPFLRITKFSTSAILAAQLAVAPTLPRGVKWCFRKKGTTRVKRQGY